MRKRTQLVGFDYGYYKHVQYVAEFIDNALDAIERFQWEENKKRARGEETFSFTLNKEISLEALTMEENSATEVEEGLKQDLAEAFEFSKEEGEALGEKEGLEEEDLGDEDASADSVEGEDEDQIAVVDPEEILEERQDEVEEVEEEVLEKEVRKILDDLEAFINPIVNLVDDEPFTVIRIKEVEMNEILRASVSDLKDARMYCFEIFDNGTGMIPEDLAKFGKYLASSKSQKLKQTRGSQGFGSPSAFSDAQNTTGMPVIAVSKHISHLYAMATEFFTTGQNTKKFNFPPTEISVPFSHGTYVKLYFLNRRYIRGYADEYIRQTAILNSHVTIIFIDPYGEEHIYPRRVGKFPEEPTYAQPHPSSVNIGDFQDLIRNSENLTVSAFLTDSFVRLSSKIAKRILAAAERSLSEFHGLVQLKNGFLTKATETDAVIYYITEEMRVFGRSKKKRKKWVGYYLHLADHPDFAGEYIDFIKKISDLETKNRKHSNKISKLKGKIEKADTKKEQRTIRKQVNQIRRDIKANVKELVKLENQLNRFLAPQLDEFTEMEEDSEYERLVEDVQDVLVSNTRPRECSMDQINHIFKAFKEQKYLSPPTDTAIPVGSDVLENVLIKEYGLDIPQRLSYFEGKTKNVPDLEDETLLKPILARFANPKLEDGSFHKDMLSLEEKLTIKDYERISDELELKRTISDDFVAGETRDPTSGKGLAFVVEAAVAMSKKRISAARKASDVLARYVNRTPKLRDNSDCAIWQSVAEVNWKNYKLDTFDNGIAKGNVRIFINVSGPFVHLMFKSQSKNALASDSNLTREIKLCLESIGRRLRTYVNKKVTQEKRKKRSSVLEKYAPQFAESIVNIANKGGRYVGKLKKKEVEQKLVEVIGVKKKPAEKAKEEEEKKEKVEKIEPDTGEEVAEKTEKEAAEPAKKKPPGKKKAKTPAKKKPAKKTKKTTKKRPAKKKTKKPAKKKEPVEPVEVDASKVKVGGGKKKAPAKKKPKKKTATKKETEKLAADKKIPRIPKIKGSLVIDKPSIIENLDDWVTIKDLIAKMGITSMMDARFLQIKLRQLEREKAVKVEIRKGKKYWKK